MTNYRKFGTKEELFEAVVAGVQVEWLTERVVDLLRVRMNALYMTAAHEKCKFLPEPVLIMEPYKWMRPSEVKVVMLGQDPYPNSADACGIAFQSLSDTQPASSRSINSSLVHYGHIDAIMRGTSDYRRWLRQGVLMSNYTLTVREGEPKSHGDIWRGFSAEILALVPRDSVALLLGGDAQNLGGCLPCREVARHCHPRAGQFANMDIFLEVNHRLGNLHLHAIDWTPGA